MPYLPAILMVLLAGFSMWIDAKSVPARITLCVTTVLTIITIIASLKSTMPKVSYLTALDIYLWICFIFVLSTVIEYTCLNTLMNKKLRKLQKVKTKTIRRWKHQHRDEHNSGATGEVPYENFTDLVGRATSMQQRRESIKSIDTADFIPENQDNFSDNFYA